MQIKTCDNLCPSRNRSYDLNGYVGCDQKTLKSLREPAFSRALFNQRYIALKGELAVFLDYEVVLSEDSEQKVDILAYKPFSKTLVAIEFKLNPDNEVTALEYGLFEAFMYGILLGKYVSTNRNKTYDAINKLLKMRLPNHHDFFSIKEPKPNEIKTEFMLAGPVSYFNEFVEKRKKLQGDRLRRICSIEAAIQNQLKSLEAMNAFAGYLLLSEVCHEKCAIVTKGNKNSCQPFMSDLVGSISEVQNSVKPIFYSWRVKKAYRQGGKLILPPF